ncbi:MAG: hypothetical protein NVSMB4_10020 [Acidimicrobiales bacterium]
MARGDWLDPRLARTTVGEFADQWFSSITNKHKTRQGYEGYLRNWVIPKLGTLPVCRQPGKGQGVCREHRQGGTFHLDT